jgi:hypothetical protein
MEFKVHHATQCNRQHARTSAAQFESMCHMRGTSVLVARLQRGACRGLSCAHIGAAEEGAGQVVVGLLDTCR